MNLHSTIQRLRALREFDAQVFKYYHHQYDGVLFIVIKYSHGTRDLLTPGNLPVGHRY